MKMQMQINKEQEPDRSSSTVWARELYKAPTGMNGNGKSKIHYERPPTTTSQRYKANWHSGKCTTVSRRLLHENQHECIQSTPVMQATVKHEHVWTMKTKPSGQRQHSSQMKYIKEQVSTNFSKEMNQCKLK